MNQGKYIFAQLTDFLPRRVFDNIVSRHDGNKKVRSFTCWNQMLCMIFGQLTARDSMRDLMLSLEAHQSKYYHLGLGASVTRTNQGKANRNRSYKIFEDFAYVMMDKARQSHYREDFEVKKTSIPTFVLITSAKVNDMNAMDYLHYESGSFYIFDRGYVDFDRLYRVNESEAWFVTRAKKNFKFRRMYSREVDKSTGVQCDQIGKLEGFYQQKDYPGKLRRIKYHDVELGRIFVFITNNMDLTAVEIALLYKKRWMVELFFKWIKQHLKVKSFWGTTINAVKIQLYCAIIAYCLVASIGYELKVERPIYEILQILSISLLDKTPIREILTNCDYKNVKELDYKQLKINWI